MQVTDAMDISTLNGTTEKDGKTLLIAAVQQAR